VIFERLRKQGKAIHLKRWFISEKSFPVRMFLLALVLRMIPVVLSFNFGIGLDDMFQYDMLARSIESGNGYRWYAEDDLYLAQQYVNFDMSSVDYDPRGVLTSFRPPLYPLFLAIIYSIFGTGADRFFVARMIQAIIGSTLVPLTYILSRWVDPVDKKWGRMAAWIITLYPMLIIYPLSLATENLFFLLVLVSVWVLFIAERTRKWYMFSLAGILLGLTALTRSVALAMAGVAILWVWMILKERKNAFLIFLSIFIVTFPWILRNSLLNHRMTGIESALGYDLYVGYHPKSTGTFQYGISLDLIPYLDDGMRDEIGQKKAIEFIMADPGRIPTLAIRRLGYFWGLERRALTYFYSNNFFGYIPFFPLFLLAIVLLLPFVVICISACFGFATVKWNRVNILIPLVILGYLTPHVFILGEDRFHLTLIPFIAIASAHCWGGGLELIKNSWATKIGKITIVIAMVVSLLLIGNWISELYLDRHLLSLLFGSTGNQTYFPY
jgi:hypothetical protein